jgi:diguanylate cyclase (GGDEF)-like protein
MTAQLRMVMVEDNVADSELVARNLSKAGLNVAIHRVETESDFVRALQTVEPDIILSDFSLPQFDGLHALDVAVVHAPETPFIFVSGTIGEERAIDALRRGATDYVLKTNLSRLPAAVERSLREVALKAEKAKSDQQRRDQEIRLQRLTRALRMLSSTGSAILRLRNRMELFDEVCRIAADQGGYDRVVISLIDPDARTLRPRAWAGTDSAPLRAADGVVLDSGPESAGMAERAIRSGAPSIHNDLALEPQPWPRHDVLIAHGYQAAASLPLLIDGTVIGVISLFSKQHDVFDPAELDVLLELTANLAFALQYLERDEAVHFLSYFDSLTGLAKRPLFCQRLAQLMSFDDGGTLTVVVFDVQKLGAINDSMGRYVGDRLLEKIAVRVKQAFPDSERAAYFGGGTFALMLSGGGNTADTGRILQNAATQLFIEPFHIDGQELRPAIRYGVAFYPHDADTADALVQNAEAALKAAREDNEKYMLFGLVTERPTSRGLALEARLSGALDRDEFRLHYQPKVDIHSGRIEGLEALLRWQDTEDGPVPPSIFIPLLERSGAIVDVGEWVLLQAVRDMRIWNAAGLAPVRVAVNVSPLQLRRRDFVDRVLASVESTVTQPCRVDVEITESMLMQDLELSIRKLAQLREAGIGIAIDDFGTGYSSLRLLAKLPVDTLKVDRSFIQGIADTPNIKTLVSTVVSLAQAFNMHTVAEGVETAEQLRILRAMNCGQAQGFLFGRPTPASEVPAAITRLSSGMTDKE